MGQQALTQSQVAADEAASGAFRRLIDEVSTGTHQPTVRSLEEKEGIAVANHESMLIGVDAVMRTL